MVSVILVITVVTEENIVTSVTILMNLTAVNMMWMLTLTVITVIAAAAAVSLVWVLTVDSIVADVAVGTVIWDFSFQYDVGAYICHHDS